ncbi:MAG: PEP-CTERM sorting domain-containing protein [Planctomycetes bacterium]|nr:PEP-CTERM sorting domain-containing protein [Planctomycetota bacterium]
MRTSVILGIVADTVLVGAAGTFATTFTVATFADPSPGSSSPLFSLHFDGSGDLDSVQGSWSGTGLTLQVPFDGSVYPDATFSMPAVSVNAAGQAGPGHVEFYDQTAALILTIDWISGTANEFGIGAQDTTTSPGNVTIQYKNFSLVSESFAFSFANQQDVGDDTMTTTAAFTSSAFPEPTTMVALGIGSLALLVQRR